MAKSEKKETTVKFEYMLYLIWHHFYDIFDSLIFVLFSFTFGFVLYHSYTRIFSNRIVFHFLCINRFIGSIFSHFRVIKLIDDDAVHSFESRYLLCCTYFLFTTTLLSIFFRMPQFYTQSIVLVCAHIVWNLLGLNSKMEMCFMVCSFSDGAAASLP